MEQFTREKRKSEWHLRQSKIRNSMPNGKTHLITGAVVGATVNLAIQSAQMAMDYDRKFDWGEFFLCAGAAAFAANPKGIASSSPGLRGTSYPGWEDERNQTLNGFRPTSQQLFEPATSPNHRQFFHSIVAAGLIAYSISGKHTLKLSRTTRLFLWAFGMSYLSHIALDSAASFRSPKPATFNFQPSTPNLL
jgi:membrane-bound metal-dependent hydrolase YbcI (DUF457 family)